MSYLIGLILFIQAGLVLLVMAVQAARRTVELVCIRNVFLLGFIIFQLLSGGLSLVTNSYDVVHVNFPDTTGFIYMVLCSIFLAIFWVSYSKGWVVKNFAYRRQHLVGRVSPAGVLPFAFLVLALGLFVRLVIGRTVPVLGILADMMGIGLLSAAAGLAIWVWAPRLFNPAVAIPAAAIFGISFLSLLFGTVSRRDALSLLVTCFLAAVYSHWRRFGLMGLGTRLAIVTGAALIFLGAFSSIRMEVARESSYGDIQRHFHKIDISEGIINLVTGEYAGANSMWVIEQYPQYMPYDPLASVVYTFVQPIPRVLWPTKPDAFGWKMGRMLSEDKKFNMGPGMIGHIVHDNPWLTLVPYAIFCGLFCRYLDEFLRAHPFNPFVVIPVATGSGEIVGIPRGEFGLFLFRAVAAMVAAWLAMRFCYAVFSRFSGRSLMEAEEGAEEWEFEGITEEEPVL